VAHEIKAGHAVRGTLVHAARESTHPAAAAPPSGAVTHANGTASPGEWSAGIRNSWTRSQSSARASSRASSAPLERPLRPCPANIRHPMSAHVANSSSHSRSFRSASHRAFAFGERARPRAAAATQSAARSSGGVPDVAYLMRPRRRPQPVFLLPRDSALRAPPSASRSSRAAGRPISLHKNTAPPRAEFGKFILPLLWLLPAGRFPCLARFRGATLPGLLGPLQASPRGGMTRRIGRTNRESGNTISRPRRRLYEWLATSHGSGRGKL